MKYNAQIAHQFNFRTLWSTIPLELKVMMPFWILWAICIVSGLPINNRGFSLLVDLHFVVPMLCASMIHIVFMMIYAYRGTKHNRNKQLIVWSIPLVIGSLFLFLNFKVWMSFINPQLHDYELYQVDLLAQPIVNTMISIRRVVAEHIPSADYWYVLAYYGLFLLSFTIHGVIDTAENYRRMVLGMCLTLMLGGISYWIYPAVGPFLYRVGENTMINPVQASMYQVFLEVRETGSFPRGYYMTALGAMPSLHTAHSCYLTLCAARSARPFLIIYLPVTAWIWIEAVASSYHYLLDIPAGIALALIAFTAATRLVPSQQRLHNQQPAHGPQLQEVPA